MNQALKNHPSVADLTEAGDYVVIRGNRLNLDSLFNKKFFDQNTMASLREQFQSASPFPHIVIDGLFNPKLLELVYAEFDLFSEASWRPFVGEYEKTQRSPPKPKLGTATQIYFSIVNSGWFINFMSSVSGIENLIPDPQFYGGGMHETRQGGHFGIHTDFNLHHKTMLDNAMIIITYLNKDWKNTYNGALELWDANSGNCAVEIIPEFGRTLLMPQGLTNLHGHSKPLASPENTTRRSVAAYYYTNKNAEKFQPRRHSTLFFPSGRMSWRFRYKYALKYKILPPSILRVPFNPGYAIRKVLPNPILSMLHHLKSLLP